MGYKLLAALSAFIVMELLALWVFSRLRQHFNAQQNNSSNVSETAKDKWWSVAKGTLERTMLLVALLYELNTILVMFGAIKLGTRLDAGKNKISNDYFLVGNFASVMLTIIAYALYKALVHYGVFH